MNRGAHIPNESLERLKFGFNRVVDGYMLCCTRERADEIVKAVNSYYTDKQRIKELEEALKQSALQLIGLKEIHKYTEPWKQIEINKELLKI